LPDQQCSLSSEYLAYLVVERWQAELRNIGTPVEGHDPIFPTSGGKPQTHANVLQVSWYAALKR